MTTQQKSSIVSTSSFAASRPMRYLNTLQRLQLSGQLLFTEPKGQQWIFHLDQGKLIYATGGIHPVRRWQRNVAFHCPQIVANSSAIKRDLASVEFTNYWDYQLLELWVKQEKITLQQATSIIHSATVDILFDVGQASNVTHQFKPTSLLSNRLVAIDLIKAIADVEPLWQAWHNASLGNYSPNQAPTIKQPDQLKQNSSPEVYETLTKFLDGKQSLRDLAVQRKWDLVEIGRSLLPYLELGWVELINIPNLPIPVSPTPTIPGKSGAIAPSAPGKQIANSTKPLVACVDDSQWVTQMMERLITTAGYRFLAIDNSIRAIPILLGRKPDLIFLDLVMPNVNGYELCTQLRKLSCFRTTPIVILTGNDGATERIRSKLVGASDFLTKPLNAANLLKVLHKYISC
ncbi:response regulator [Limnofasciculus baicalensis]|uniref:Response regulator n=1 Tax=Limnofasciculus baicalensis BBK-W-15 TaxID=2699891 RepID=A0AAE3GP24_9CYAN|nr:response regulator [Limnofasciculus baicalensis]MCP2728095.1 response regulator [Limnofasciculus baicalensis BBK-W-15]